MGEVQSPTQLCNLALSHLGVGMEIQNLTTEGSAEAIACRRFYPIVRRVILRAFPWPFATRFVALNLVETDPTTEWKYAYRYPSECLRIRRILSGTRNDDRQTRVPYKEASDSTGKLIYTDQAEAVAEITVDVEEVNKFDDDFSDQFALRLAAYVAPKLTSGDPFKMGERAMKIHIALAGEAQATAMNEQQDEELPNAEWITGR